MSVCVGHEGNKGSKVCIVRNADYGKPQAHPAESECIVNLLNDKSDRKTLGERECE